MCACACVEQHLLQLHVVAHWQQVGAYHVLVTLDSCHELSFILHVLPLCLACKLELGQDLDGKAGGTDMTAASDGGVSPAAVAATASVKLV